MIDWSQKSLVINGAPAGSVYYYFGGVHQSSNVFTTGPDGNAFAPNVLYQLYAYHETLLPEPRLFALRFRIDGSIEALNSFEAGPGARLPVGQPVTRPPQPPLPDARTSLLGSLSFGLLVRCSDQPDFADGDADSKDYDSTAINPNDPLYDTNDTSPIDYAQ